MTLETFQSFNFRSGSLDTIEQANSIISEYQGQGFTLTLRQLYYQFVARGLIENTSQSYDKLGAVLTKARLAGMVSWTSIEDRGRGMVKVWGEATPEEVLDGIERGLVLDPWEGQDFHVEVWIEKEALHAVIERPCNQYRVGHTACKGYLSASEAWRSGKRFERAAAEGKKLVIIHLGDHDPSGLDMTRDNQERATLFSWNDVEIERIALNFDQVQQYDPPPNFAKVTDSRAKGYIEEHGEYSWELDALEPKVINDLVKQAIQRRITDRAAWDAVFAEERERRTLLRKLPRNWDAVRELLEELGE